MPNPGIPKYSADHPDALWTSFDRYARYGAIVRALRACLGAGRRTVLDVGDPSGYLTAFDHELTVVCADLTVVADPLSAAVRMAASGTHLPFPDASFDAVVTSDALEHVPDELRPAFLSELARVSRDVVIVAAPFATPGVEGAETLARRYTLLVTGAPQDQLEEHAERGLPALADAVADLESAGLDVAFEGNGNLNDWLLLMMLKQQLIARPALLPLDDAYDIAYNLVFSERNRVGPFYRYVVCGRRAGAPSLGPAADPDAQPHDTVALLGSWLTAAVAELSRQDTATEVGVLHRRSEAVEERLSRLEAAVSALTGLVEATQVGIADVRAAVGDVQAVVETTHGLIRHPVRSVVGKVQRRNE